jgi:hypothetical protein
LTCEYCHMLHISRSLRRTNIPHWSPGSFHVRRDAL